MDRSGVRTPSLSSLPRRTSTGDIVARDVTIEGRVDGQIIATDVVEVRPGATLAGRVISKRFILEPDADVRARVEPQHLDTAIRVARFQQQKRTPPGETAVAKADLQNATSNPSRRAASRRRSSSDTNISLCGCSSHQIRAAASCRASARPERMYR